MAQQTLSANVLPARRKLSSTPSTEKGQPPTMRSTMDRVDRASFSSTKESHTDSIAQSFTDSKTSSYLRNEFTERDYEEAIDDSASIGSGCKTPDEKAGKALVQRGGMVTRESRLLGFVCPCDGFKGWKGIQVRGRIASRSSSDLRGLGAGGSWEWDCDGDLTMSGVEIKPTKMVKGRYLPGQSPLETLPMELLGAIIDKLASDIPPNGFTARNIDLMSLLLTSREIHAATLSTLYHQITIPHSRIFRKFLSHITEFPSLGTIVRRLDFSHFNPTGAGLTARERAQTLNLIPETLLECLSLTPNLREFLAQEHIDDDLSADVLHALFNKLPKLQAVDFCAASSASFRNAFTTLVESPLPNVLPITRLSLHECTVLPATVFTTLLPKFPKLTHLDVAHTRITDSALHSIPTTARLTHLNLSKCSNLSGLSVVEFLTTHPAAKSLVYLNLAMDAKSHEMLTSDDITNILPALPTTLRSLNLKGSKMGPEHISGLLPLTKHLEELGLGRHLKLANITELFVPDQNAPVEVQMEWIPHTLRYIDASDLSASELDLGSLFGKSCPLLQSVAEPLEVIELGTECTAKVLRSEAVVKRVGWCLKEAGRRGWLVRVRATGNGDNGERSWKWGATYWGMRKVPVARAEVGGMFGHYMFKR